jgi:GDP-L-fucose synthase
VYLDNKRVFLAGATGSVGTAILAHLIERYPAVRIRAAVHTTKPLFAQERVEYVSGDLRSPETCRVMARGCDCAIMAASHSGGSKTMTQEPWLFLNDNIAMNTALLEAFYHEQVRRVIFIGSSTVYQEFDGFVREEDLDLNAPPHAAYFGVGWVTRFIEKLCAFWHQKTGMETVILRAANIFGPYASFDPARSYFIPAIIRKAAEGLDPFEVWGSPDVIRDVLFSEDFADAVVRALNDESIKHDVFNVGSGLKTTVGEVVNWALKYTGHTPSKVHFDSTRPTTIRFRALSIEKAQRALGWKPATTPEAGVMKTARWWLKNKDQWNK